MDKGDRIALFCLSPLAPLCCWRIRHGVHLYQVTPRQDHAGAGVCFGGMKHAIRQDVAP